MKNHALSTWRRTAFAFALFLASSARLFAIAGLEGTFEFGLDAPWRIEPQKKPDGGIDYGAIPIQITIHGARHAKLDNIIYPDGPNIASVALPDNVVSLGSFRSVRVTELGLTETNTVEFALNSLHEIESTAGDWPWPSNAASRPIHKICRVWNGENPEPFRDITDTSEWHATLYYIPKNKTPDTAVVLQIEVLLERPSWPPPPLQYAIKTTQGNLPVTFPLEFGPAITLRNYARVFLSRDPLPRFDRRWLYGDLHYHSQGTDNEGEAGYNYRGVIRAMGAMGLDFVFATDHASNSEQIIDADLPNVAVIPETAHSQGDRLREDNVRSTGGVLRDMDASRFAFAHNLIYGPQGVNNEATLRAANFRFPQNYLSYGVVPQLFLGGEVDAVPEVKVSTVRANTTQGFDGKILISIPYGNGLSFNLETLCAPLGCDDPRNALLGFGDPDSNLVNDFQSLESFQFYGRQHLVYFPNSSSLTVGDDTAFVASRTSRFGGATRRLDNPFIPTGQHTEPLLPEFERKGVVFIAHHLNAADGGRGPDSVPWTADHMLLKAFRSPAVLGLQFWNENGSHRTAVCSHDFCRDNGRTYLGRELGYERNEELEADSNNPIEDFFIGLVNLLGGNLLPKEFHQIALPLEEVRRGFISGGASGGLFELVPFNVKNNSFQSAPPQVGFTLHHGAFDWDTLNLRGLDFERNTNLTWLKPGEPRRVFMAGGSDAHGDLNYRRAGYFLGTDDVNNTAIGRPRNLVFVGDPEGPAIFKQGPVIGPASASGQPAPTLPASPRLAQTAPQRAPILNPNPAPVRPPTVTPPVAQPPVGNPPEVIDPGDPPPSGSPVRPPGDVGGPIGGLEIRTHTQEQVVQALRSGRFCITDGAALRLAIDMNANNLIDDEDIQMGGVHSFDKRVLQTQPIKRGQKINLLTEVVSNQEFGAIMRIDLYIGVHPDPALSSPAPVEPRMYAPQGHGPADPGPDAVPSPQISYDSNGRSYVRRKDTYWDASLLGDAVTWRFNPGDPLRFTHTLVTSLDLDKYQVGSGVAADRFFVRAFAVTGGNLRGDSVGSRVFSNPIWVRRNEPAFDPVAGGGGGVIDPVDPEPPVAEIPTVNATVNTRGEVVITFTGICTFSPSLTQPFQDIVGATSPYVVAPTQRTGFFRARARRP